MKKIILFLAVVISFASCNNDEDVPPNNNFVSIKTVSHTLNDDGGVTLKGEIKNVELPIDYGILVSTDENILNSNYANTKLNTGIYNGQYTIDFNSDLIEGLTYYYKALALKNGEYIYGTEKSFVSDGSASPQITSIVPNKAHLRDTIIINGLNFSKNPSVYFNTWQSELLIKNDTLIKCIVNPNPNYNSEALPSLELNIKSWTANETITNEFALHTPKVDSIRPYQAFPGDTITIYGDHFYRNPSGNRIIIPSNYGTAAYPQVIRANQKELVFVLNQIKDYYPTIQIESQHQTITVENEIKHILPEITGISTNSVKYDDELVVYGSNFPNQNSYTYDVLQYSFGTEQMYPFVAHKDSLVITISDVTQYEDFVISGLSIDFFGNTIEYNEDIILDENYVRVEFNQDNIIAYGTIGDDVYAVAYPYFYTDKYLVKLNTETHRFDKLYPESYLTNAPSGLYFEFYGTKFYSFENSNGELMFKSYDIFTNVETQLTSFPGESRMYPFMEVVGDYLYYGLGMGNAGTTGFDDIWRYSFANDTWEFLLNFPGIDSYETAKIKPLSFSIGDKIYIGSGQTNYNQLVDFWEFDTSTNVVTSKTDLPITIPLRIKGLNVNNKGVFDIDSNTYIYDPMTDEWTIKQTGMNFSGYNKHLLQTDDYIYSENDHSLIKIKIEYFNN